MNEISRFVNAVAAGELWEQIGDYWHMVTPHATALVWPRARYDGAPGYFYGVNVGGKLVAFASIDDEGEAMRQAERVVEEHRP